VRWVRVVLAALALGAGICRAGAASAQSAPPSTWRPEVHAGLAYASPFGSFERASSAVGAADPAVSRVVSGALTLTLGAGLRRQGAFYAGLSGALAYVGRRHVDCPGVEPCTQLGSGYAVRTTLDAEYRFRARHPVGPWLGLGAGLEWLGIDDVTYRSLPFVAADVGITVLSRASSAMDLYLGVSMGRFVHADSAAGAFTGSMSGFGGSPPPTSRSIDDPAWHGWVEFGVRGTAGF